MNWDTPEFKIFERFAQFGEVERVVLVKDHHTGKSRGFGFVYFNDLEPAKRAKVEMDGVELDGRNIRVDYSLTERKTDVYRGDNRRDDRGGRDRYWVGVLG